MIRTPYDWPRPEVPHENSELWPVNAWRDRGIGLEVIDAQRMFVTFANGISLPIVALYDAEGHRVEDWEDAASYDFGSDSFGYGAANCHHSAKQVN